jgi:predicted ATPase/transcriptional regulator with XRE-family HTH domain
VAGEQERYGERLRHYREAAGYSQEDLGERAGLSANAISALERGERKRPYPDTLRRLADALGLSDAQRSELAALRGGPEAPAVPLAPGPRQPRPAADLPGEPTPLIGREAEAKVVRHLLAHLDGRLLTLLGPGGVGKTRLALHVTRSVTDQYPDGVVWVELAPLADPSLVLSTIVRAMGLDEPLGGDPGATLRSWLRERQVLLVLDNVEHVLDAVPELAHLLQACRYLQILATSRSSLGIRGEQEYVVPPLELPPAGRAIHADDVARVSSVQLFVQRARQKHPTFTLTDENAPIVAAICRRLDGLPLALELVAARVRVLSLPELLARLDQLMSLLVGGSRDLPHRQQTIRATIGWSYDLLGSAEQALFRRLSVFAGGWTLEAAESVAAWGDIAGAEVIDLLSSLVEQSLVSVTQEQHETRYWLLEPIRQYAGERLQASGEAAETRLRHAEYYQKFAETAAPEFEGKSEQLHWLDRTEREHDNLRAALAWCQEGEGRAGIELRITAALWRFWEIRGHTVEGIKWLTGALTRSEGQPPRLRANALNAAGNLARDRADFAWASACHEECLAIRRELNDTRGIAISLNNLGVIARDRRDAQRTIELCEESLALFRSLGDHHRSAIVMISLGVAASEQGDHAQARAWYEESLAVFRAARDGWHTAWLLTYLAEAMLRQGDLVAARRTGEESLALHRAANDVWGIARALSIQGKLAQVDDDLDSAATRFAEALSLLVGAGVERGIPGCLEDLAGIMLVRGEPEQAARLAGGAVALREQIGITQSAGEGTAPVADVSGMRTGPQAAEWSEGRALTGEQVIAEALALAGEISHPASG